MQGRNTDIQMETKMEDMNSKSALYTYEELDSKPRPELNKLARKLKIDSLKGKNTDIIERMILKSKTVRCTWDEEGDLVAPLEEAKTVGGVRKHPVLGQWKMYVVEARESELKDEQFANNDFAARIQMGKEVSLPESFAKFIANSCYSFVHFYDETKIDPETGKYGLHTKRKEADFFVRPV